MHQRIFLATVPIMIIVTIGCGSKPPPSSHAPASDGPISNKASLIKGKVVSVVDEVTVDVDIGGEISRLRYLGVSILEKEIDWVDYSLLRERAFEFNRFRVENKIVEIERDVIDVDSLGNILRYVYVDGEMMNTIMISSGYAIVSSYPTEFKYKRAFVDAELRAKNDRLGYWRHASTQEPNDGYSEDDSGQPFLGGTLPALPNTSGGVEGKCDYSGTYDPVIKGNVDTRTKERIYLVPDNLFYSTTEVNPKDGDIWICTESEAIESGWVKAEH